MSINFKANMIYSDYEKRPVVEDHRSYILIFRMTIKMNEIFKDNSLIDWPVIAAQLTTVESQRSEL